MLLFDLFVTDAVVTTAAAVPASEGGRCLVIPRQSQTPVFQPAGGVQQIPGHNEGIQVADVRLFFPLAVIMELFLFPLFRCQKFVCWKSFGIFAEKSSYLFCFGSGNAVEMITFLVFGGVDLQWELANVNFFHCGFCINAALMKFSSKGC